MKPIHILRVVLVLMFCASYVSAQELGQRTITVTGEGSASAKPDNAVITMTVTIKDTTLHNSFTRNTAFDAKLRSTLAKFGVKPKDITLRHSAVNPTYNYAHPDGTPKLISYHYVCTYAATVRNLKNLAKVLDAVSSTGAANVTIESYGYSKSAQLDQKAMKIALADAKAKALRLAKKLGASPGAVVSITDRAVPLAPPEAPSYEELEKKRAALPTVDPSVVTSTTSLTVTYSIK